MSGGRRKAREVAIQTLFSMEFADAAVDDAVRHMRHLSGEPLSDDPDLAQLVQVTADSLAFAERLVRGVISNRDALDAVIGQCSTNWKVPRMALVDRNILRLAAYELRFVDEIPPKVTMNEAIEIAKRYGTAESSAFINGIIDRIATLTAKPASGAAPAS
ncbi:MAG: N utilization substance protein B [Myxococcota bacterium]|jgi:N utilization substance protein B